MQWKRVHIDGQETNYLISEYGDLKNSTTGTIRKNQLTKGYVKFVIPMNKKLFNRPAHRLVAEYFLEVENEDIRKLAVNHIDGNKANNYYKNLEYVTNKENTTHAIKLGLIRPDLQAKKAVKVYDKKGKFLFNCKSLTEAAEKTGITAGDVSVICNKKGGAKIANDFQFRFLEDEDAPTDLTDYRSGIKQSVSQYDLNYNLINTFNTIVEANSFLSKFPSSGLIGQCCKGKAKTAYGYIWKYNNN
jgi:hypothetical protein